MPEVSQESIDGLSTKLDTIIKMQIDIKKELADLRNHHDQISFSLRRKGPINRK